MVTCNLTKVDAYTYTHKPLSQLPNLIINMYLKYSALTYGYSLRKFMFVTFD